MSSQNRARSGGGIISPQMITDFLLDKQRDAMQPFSPCQWRKSRGSRKAQRWAVPAHQRASRERERFALAAAGV